MRKLLYTVALFVMASACSTKPESKPYNWEDDLHQRLLTDFCMTESQVKDYIRKYIPDGPMSRCASGKPPKLWSA